MQKLFFVYMLASTRNGTLYIGSTSNLVQRIHQHKTKAVGSFTKRYAVDRLVWFERHECAASMVTRERQLKDWNREWKIRLIETSNPTWKDLYGEILT